MKIKSGVEAKAAKTPKVNDKLLIRWYIDLCIEAGCNQTDIAERVGRTRSWASLLVQGKITRLCFDTRNRIKTILGIQGSGS